MIIERLGGDTANPPPPGPFEVKRGKLKLSLLKAGKGGCI